MAQYAYKREIHTKAESPELPSPTKSPEAKRIKMELTEDERKKVRVPKNWERVLELMEQQRAEIVTPVDTMGCEENGQEERRADRGRVKADGTPESPEEAAKRLRFTTLVSLMLSSQTKDPISASRANKRRTQCTSCRRALKMDSRSSRCRELATS